MIELTRKENEIIFDDMDFAELIETEDKKEFSIDFSFKNNKQALLEVFFIDLNALEKYWEEEERKGHMACGYEDIYFTITRQEDKEAKYLVSLQGEFPENIELLGDSWMMRKEDVLYITKDKEDIGIYYPELCKKVDKLYEECIERMAEKEDREEEGEIER